MTNAVESDRSEWIRDLPRLIDRIEEQWALEIGDPFEPGGQTAWVAPVRAEAGTDLVLKLMWRHMEAENEADGLREWHGDGAVQIYRAENLDDTTTAMLLERCRPGTSLADRPPTEQDVVIASLLLRLWRQPSVAQFRPLQIMCDTWADEFEERRSRSNGTIDAGLAGDGIALFRELPRSSERDVLLCTDLHAENVLAARREPWLVIDPKPFFGDPSYDVLQHMLNCQERLLAHPRALVRRMADLVDLDAERILLWLFARCVQESPDQPVLADVARMIAPT